MPHNEPMTVFRLMQGGFARTAGLLVLAPFLLASIMPVIPLSAQVQEDGDAQSPEEETVVPLPPDEEQESDGRELEEQEPEEPEESEEQELIAQFHTTDATIVARKVVCEDEADLPNWGSGGADIDSTTAEEWVEEHPGCFLADDWSFEWKTEGDQSNPGGDTYGPAGGDWHTFIADGEMAIVNLPVEGVSLIEMREVLQDGYIPFSDDASDDVSAEFYCASDVAGYDNWEWIQNPEAGVTYHCVGFNVSEEQPEDSVTLHTQKILCDDESDLPNWGAGDVAASIDADTAADWLADNEGNGCELARWQFQWVDDTVSNTNPGDQTEVAGAGWSEPFGGSTLIDVTDISRVWVREVADAGHLPFSGQNTDQDVSAEMYCGTDVLHYDNWELIDIPEDHASDYYCVAWNVPIEEEEPEACRIEVVTEEGDEGVGNDNAVLAFIHAGWTTALNTVASWIWDTEFVENPGIDEEKTFTKDFFVDTEIDDATLRLAADNRYSISINGTEVAADTGEFNYGSITEVILATSTIMQGWNTIEISVENIGVPGEEDPQVNPAGGIYQLMINEEAIEDCDVPPPPPGDDDDDSSITIIKEVAGTTTSETFDFDASWLDQDVDFTLGAGASTTFTGLATGTYAVSEVLGAETEWELQGVVCDDANSTSTTENGIEINLEDEEDVTCTFTNALASDADETGTLVVTKTVVNDSGTGSATTSDFTLQVIDGNGATTTVSSGVVGAFATGTYSVMESGPGGYEATFGGDCSANGSVTVAAGATSTCTIENDDLERLPDTTAVFGTKWNDLNDNGVRDLGEPGVAGVTVSISNDATT
ncbi:MAG TPA: hypothetical protein VJ837_01145, partial [Candidatus Paceibacterota bacterium]|nr:hypothetical protein [Candidatus Paceibacterota bacterium]